MDLFARPTSNAMRIAEIKACVVRSLGLSEEATVLVTELQCREEGCPPLETVIAVFRPGGPKLQLKLHQPLAEVADQDVARLCFQSLTENQRKEKTENVEHGK
jgi:hypothetical protein